MEPFFETVVQEASHSLFLRKVAGKYHYSKEELPLLKEVRDAMLSCMKGKAAWEWFSNSKTESSFLVAMTLGADIDQLQEQYLLQQRLSEAYMVEALGSEILLKGYEALNQWVKEHTEYFVERYFFLGSDDNYPLTSLPQVLEKCTLPLSCNQSFCMLPKKSVVFVAKLTKDKEAVCPGICVGCTSENCPNRMPYASQTGLLAATDKLLNYGYGKIFGKKKS